MCGVFFSYRAGFIAIIVAVGIMVVSYTLLRHGIVDWPALVPSITLPGTWISLVIVLVLVAICPVMAIAKFRQVLGAEKRETTRLAIARAEADVATAAVKRKLALVQAILDATPIPLFYKDVETRYRGINRAFEEMYGVKREDIIGKKVSETTVLSKAERDFWQAENEQVMRNREASRVERNIRFSDGQNHFVIYQVQPFDGPDGEPAGSIGAFVDITHLKRVQSELEDARDVAGSLPVQKEEANCPD